MNRRGPLDGLRGLLSGPGRKLLYGILMVVAGIAAITLDLFLEVPFIDVLVMTLAGALVTLLANKEGEQTGQDGDSALDRLLKRLGDPLSTNERSGDRAASSRLQKGRDQLALHEVCVVLALAHDGPLAAADHHLGGSRAGVVVGGHGEAVGPRAHHG